MAAMASPKPSFPYKKGGPLQTAPDDVAQVGRYIALFRVSSIFSRKPVVVSHP